MHTAVIYPTAHRMLLVLVVVLLLLLCSVGSGGAP